MELDDASTLRFNRGGGEEGRENGPRLKRCPAGRGGEGGGGGSLLMPFRAIYTSTTYSCIYMYVYMQDRRRMEDPCLGFYCQGCLYTVAIDETTSRHAIARSSFPFHWSLLEATGTDVCASLFLSFSLSFSLLSRRRIKGKFNDDLPIFENPCDFSILSPLCLGTGTCANLELRAIINPAKVEFTRENLLNGRRGAVWDSVSHLISFLPFPRSKGGNFERIERGFDKTRYYNNPSFQYFVK